MKQGTHQLCLVTQQPARHPCPTVKARALAYLIFARPDLDLAERFLLDFGLQTAHRDDERLYMRGTEATPYCYRIERARQARFMGFALELSSREDLDRIARLPGASEIKRLEGPGGGLCVRLTDPSGFLVEAVYGRLPCEPIVRRSALPVNLVDASPRINAPQRPPVTPPEVVRLGHIVLEVADYQATCAWYTRHFGFIPSDVQVLPDGSPVVTFMRLDLGDEPADHHTLALAQGFMAAYSHSAFEVVDADAVGMGQRILQERGWKHAWGIGRHILGSQIFDYWQDPWSNKHEHYCDGDLFTSDRPMGLHKVSAEAMSQWGQRMPRSFTKPAMSWASFKALLRNLRYSPDLTWRKLLLLKRLFG